ncbi:MAG TPA: AraC family transcriptional regulator [Methylomirabilota bacterium]|nr:AraC family transcriptional regulator [Methylomirabilota bacterium]
MDLLWSQLDEVHLCGGVFFRARFSAPFCVESPSCDEVADLLGAGPRRVIPFHLVADGTCEARLDGRRPVTLNDGDVVVFLHDGPHVMASPGARGPTPIAPLLPPPPYHGVERIELGGPGAVSRLICGFLFHDRVSFNPLLDGLPELLVVTSDAGDRGARHSRIFSLIEEESSTARPGSGSLLARLTELLFVEVLRSYMEAMVKGDRGWLAGLRDPFVARVLRLFNDRPDHPWDLASLSREAGLSRSALAARFTDALGEPPMRYLTRLRMQRASNLLEHTDLPLAGVAARVGYASEVSFNRAFRRTVGVPPATWRRRTVGSARAAR